MNYEEIANIVIQAQKGDVNAFTLLYEKTKEEFYYYAVNNIGVDYAEDVLHESYISLFKNIKSLNNPIAFKSWFCKIINNQSIAVRKKNNKYILVDEDNENYFSEIENENIEFLPLDAFEDKEKRKIILDAFEKLPDLQKQTLLMFYYEDMKIKQIAEIMETSENTVKSYLNYGRKKLEKALGEKKSKNMLAVAPIPILALILKDTAKAYAMTPEQSLGLLSRVLEGAGLSTVSSSASSASSVKATTAKAVGKGASMSASAKAVAVVVAASITVGAIGGAVLANYDNQKTSVEKTALEIPQETPQPKPTVADKTVAEIPKPESPYVGLYRNREGNYLEITIDESGNLIYSDTVINTNNVQDNGSIRAYEKYAGEGVAKSYMYLYPDGVKLSAYNHATSKEEQTDETKLRMFLTFSDLPDIRSNVYYMTEALKSDEKSFLPKKGAIYDYALDGVHFGKQYIGITKEKYIKSTNGELTGEILEITENGKSYDTTSVNKKIYFEDSSGLYIREPGQYGRDTYELLIIYPVNVGDKFERNGYPAEVKSINETVTTDAGTFDNVVHVFYQNFEEHVFYAPCIGPVKYEYVRSNINLVKITE